MSLSFIIVSVIITTGYTSTTQCLYAPIGTWDQNYFIYLLDGICKYTYDGEGNIVGNWIRECINGDARFAWWNTVTNCTGVGTTFDKIEPDACQSSPLTDAICKPPGALSSDGCSHNLELLNACGCEPGITIEDASKCPPPWGVPLASSLCINQTFPTKMEQPTLNQTPTVTIEWIDPITPLIPRSFLSAAAGIYNDSIYIFGGASSVTENQMVAYDIKKNRFIDYGASVLPVQSFNYVQFYTQIENSVYMNNGLDGNAFSIYNMKTNVYLINNISIPHATQTLGCVTSTANYLFVIGGYNMYEWDIIIPQMFNLKTRKWIPNLASLNQGRRSPGCTVDENDNIYAIGGRYYLDGFHYLSSIERISINCMAHESVWQYFGNLSHPIYETFAMKYRNYILILTGLYKSGAWVDTVHMIDTSTDQISLLPNRLPYGVHGSSLVITDTTLYVFGGNPNRKYWIYFDLSILPEKSTYSPNIAESNVPSLFPSIAPIPDIETTVQIATNEIKSTIQIGSKHENHKFVLFDALRPMYLLLVVCGLLLLCILILLAVVFAYNYKRKKQKYDNNLNDMVIHNAMVIVIGIGHYEKDPVDADIELQSLHLNNLPIENDVINVCKLFGSENLNYHVYPKYKLYDNDNVSPNIYWTQTQIITLLEQKAKELAENINVYDGLIVVISCQSVDYGNYLCTSDMKIIEKLAVHRIFTTNYDNTREIPRIFIFDLHDQQSEYGKKIMSRKKSKLRKYLRSQYTLVQEDEQEDGGKGFVAKDVEKQRSVLWDYETKNPDHKLLQIMCTNTNSNVQLKYNADDGSYMLNKFVQKMLDDLNDGKQSYIHDIFDDIQQELHEKNLQVVPIYNDKTRYVKFKRNNNGQKTVDKDTESVELQQYQGNDDGKEEEIDDGYNNDDASLA